MNGTYCLVAAGSLVAKFIRGCIAALILAMSSPTAHADWHYGRITQLMFGYDGSTVSFVLSGWNRSNCTCYSTWPNSMCLNRARVSFKEEYAWVLKSRAMDQPINVNIDEATCAVVGMYETD